MKTVRITYSSDTAKRESDLTAYSSVFTIDKKDDTGKVIGKLPEPVSLKPDNAAHYFQVPTSFDVDGNPLTFDNFCDMLVEDSFDVASIQGTIVKIDPANPIHLFAGKEGEKQVADNTGKIETQATKDPSPGIK